MRQEYRYEHLTWPEINEAVAQEKVVVLPVAAIEQHGHHLPLDVDAKLATSVCLAAGERSPASMLVLPPVSYGYCHHVMDFPGTISVQPTTFVNLLIDITTSVAYHGFTRIVLVNGHGSNHPLVEQAARQVTLRTGALCLNISWWQLIADYWNEEVRESGPGGSAHACELETSMYLHIDGDRVRKDRIKGAPASYLTDLEGGAEWQMADLTLGSGPATIVEWTSSTTETGSFGAPELATAEKGRLVFERTTERLVELVDWFRARPASERQEHHDEGAGLSIAVRVLMSLSAARFAELGVATTYEAAAARGSSAELSSASCRARGLRGRPGPPTAARTTTWRPIACSTRCGRARWSCSRRRRRGRRRSWASSWRSRRGHVVLQRCWSTERCGTSTSSWRSACPCGHARCARRVPRRTSRARCTCP